MGNLLRATTSDVNVLDLLFGAFTATPNPQYESRKKDLCGYHHLNSFAALIPEMSLFSKICNRS